MVSVGWGNGSGWQWSTKTVIPPDMGGHSTMYRVPPMSASNYLLTYMAVHGCHVHLSARYEYYVSSLLHTSNGG